MRRAALLLLSCAISVSLAASTVDVLRPFDTNANGVMELDELIRYFVSRGADEKTATAAAHDALSAFGCPRPCPGISIAQAADVVDEVFDVIDPAGNKELAALKRRTSRGGIRIDVIIRPTLLSERLAFKFKGFERYALGNGDSHSYTESFLTYDLDEDGKAQFTAIYRHGCKPPDFSAKDQWLIGIGIQR